MRRWRLVLPKWLRESIFFQLKQLASTHGPLLDFCVRNAVWSDKRLLNEHQLGKSSYICDYDVLYPYQTRVYSESMLPNQSLDIQNLNLVDPQMETASLWARAIHGCLREFRTSRKRKPSAQSKTDVKKFYYWLRQLRFISLIAGYKQSSAIVPPQALLDAFRESRTTSWYDVQVWYKAYKESGRYGLPVKWRVSSRAGTSCCSTCSHNCDSFRR